MEAETNEGKAAYQRDRAREIFDVIHVRKSGISYIVERSGVDEDTVITVLQALNALPLPDVAFERLRKHGATPAHIAGADIGFRHITLALIMQHCGLLSGEGPDHADDT